MKEAAINCRHTAVAYGRTLVVTQPSSRADDDPALLVALQGATILRSWFSPTLPVPDDRSQLFAQPVFIVAAIRDQGSGFCRGHLDTTSSPFAGSQRNTLSCRPPQSTPCLCPAWPFRHRRPFYRWSETGVLKRFAPLQLRAFVQLAQEHARHIPARPLAPPGLGVGPRRGMAKETLRPSSTSRSSAGGCLPSVRLLRFESRGNRVAQQPTVSRHRRSLGAAVYRAFSSKASKFIILGSFLT
jgi:hypothetical protein